MEGESQTVILIIFDALVFFTGLERKWWMEYFTAVTEIYLRISESDLET